MHKTIWTSWIFSLLLAAGAYAQTNQTVGDGCWTSSIRQDTQSASGASCVKGIGPGSRAYYVVSGDGDGEDNIDANADDGDRDSARLNVSRCTSITTLMVKKIGDSNAFAGILMMDFPFQDPNSGPVTVNTSAPICADIDYDGDIDTADCIPMTGDTGIDQDNSGSGLNDSLFWAWGPLPTEYIWFDVTTAPGANKTGVFVVACGDF